MREEGVTVIGTCSISTTASALAALAVPFLGLAGCGGESGEQSASGSTSPATPSPPTSPPPPASTEGWASDSGPYTEEMEDFCEVPGLAVRLEETTDTVYTSTVRRGLPYRMGYDTSTTVYTNVETGKSATAVGATTERIVKATNNGDGTLTLTELSGVQQ